MNEETKKKNFYVEVSEADDHSDGEDDGQGLGERPEGQSVLVVSLPPSLLTSSSCRDSARARRRARGP